MHVQNAVLMGKNLAYLSNVCHGGTVGTPIKARIC
uniref:Uncharacterized protein n=1 Tax=Anguilla anguilla TaxID=7936 RepID=A0A0E9SN53_ANGAN